MVIDRIGQAGACRLIHADIDRGVVVDAGAVDVVHAEVRGGAAPGSAGRGCGSYRIIAASDIRRAPIDALSEFAHPYRLSKRALRVDETSRNVYAIIIIPVNVGRVREDSRNR